MSICSISVAFPTARFTPSSSVQLLWQTRRPINFAQGEFVMLRRFSLLARCRPARRSGAILIGILLSMLLLPGLQICWSIDASSRRAALAIATCAAIGIKERWKQFLQREACLPLHRAGGPVDFGRAVSCKSIGSGLAIAPHRPDLPEPHFDRHQMHAPAESHGGPSSRAGGTMIC